MKWAVSFPEESILLVRPCLIALCHGNRPAAKLLSVLIYRYSLRLEHKSDAENINEVKAANGETKDQDTTFRIYRKQSQLVTDMCDEITEKTLHDVAVPMLQLFGYLDVDESPAIHCYDLHMDVVVAALEAYKLGTQQLEKFLIAHLQLEKFLINKKNFQLNKKNFQLALEKVLIANRNFSNNKRGRKPRREAAGEAQSEEPQINLDCLEIDSEIGNENEGANAPTPAHLLKEVDEKLEEVEEVQRRITGEHPAVKPTDTESHYHIANGSAIGKTEEEPTDPALPAVRLQAVAAGQAPHVSLPIDAPVRQSTVLKQAPGALTRVQAQPLSAPTPAQADFPPAGSVEPAPTAQTKGFTPPKRPQGKTPLVSLTLMGSQVMQWVGEIRGAKPRMTQSNIRGCNGLAECDGVSRESLQAYFAHMEAQHKDVDLLTAAGETGNDKVGFLSFESNWPLLRRKLGGQSQAPPPKKEGTDFDIYKGNGPEEREQALRDYEQRKADGTLIW